MAKLLLLPSAETDWAAQRRLAGDTDLPLSEAGMRMAVGHAPVLASFNPTAVYSGPEESARQTASLVAHELRLRSRAIDGLKEVSLGHWQGLTEEEFEERFGKVARVWRSEPLSVTPPEGESLLEADARLSEALAKLVKRRKDDTLVLVLGPMACALMRCRFAPDGFERFWEFVDESPTHHELDATAADFKRPAVIPPRAEDPQS